MEPTTCEVSDRVKYSAFPDLDTSRLPDNPLTTFIV